MSRRINRDDIDKFHDCKLYIPTRTIYMGSEVGGDEESGCESAMAERFVKNLFILDHASSEMITVIMNNIGGDEYHGLAMYDAIMCSQSPVTIKVLGHAMSMGSIILQAADVRMMAPTSRQMIHYGTWGYEGHAKTAQKWSQEGQKIDKWMENMYLKRIQYKKPEFSMDMLKNMLDHDTFLTAQESVALGLADKIIPLRNRK